MKKSVFVIILLVGLYVGAQAIADVGATKFLQIGAYTLPAGTLMFALTFTLRDLIHKRMGKNWARGVILTAGLVNIIQSLYLFLMTRIATPVWFNGEAWNATFSLVPAITIASIFAEVITQLIDTEVYHAVQKHWKKAPQFMRVLVSNVVALPLDSVLFAVFAFVVLPRMFGATGTGMREALMLTVGQIWFKLAVTVVSMPLIYLIHNQPQQETESIQSIMS